MKTRRSHLNLVILMMLLALALLAGCASVPRATPGPPPAWAREAPDAGEDHEYFVARGTDPAGDPDVALELAADSLVAQILDAIAVDVPPLADPDARASLDALRAGIEREAAERPGTRPPGFRIVERHVEQDADGVTVSLLGEFARAALEAERSRRIELVAAWRAADADRVLRGAPAALGRSVREATALAEGIRIRAVSGPREAFVGEAPPRPVRFVVVDADEDPVAGLPVAVTLDAGEAGGARPSGTGTPPIGTAASDASGSPVRRAVTGPDGGVEITLPALARVGEVRVRARIDPDAALPAFAGATGPAREDGARLASALAGPDAVWRFEGVSRAPSIPTTVLVFETDAGGTPMPSRRTRDGIEQALAESGFRLVANDAAVLVGNGPAQDDVVRALQNQLPAAAHRAVYGEATIVDFDDSEGVVVTVSATIMTVDLNSGRVIHSVSAVKNARSSSAAQALNTAFLQLGRSIGEELAASLP